MVTCPECGTRLASRSRLPGHYRTAHPRKSLVGGEVSRRSGIPKVHSVPAEIVSARRLELKPGYQMPGNSLGLVDSSVALRPPLTDAVILRTQYHALMALATRLDRGVGTEREQAAFEAGLREYNANFERVRGQRKLVSE